MKSFAVDITVAATAYIEAATEEEAKAIALAEFGTTETPQWLDLGHKDIFVNELIGLSPAMTVLTVGEPWESSDDEED